MAENAEIAAHMQEAFRAKMEVEITALGEAFGKKTARIMSMAMSNSLEHMRKTYPDVVFKAKETSLWDVMGLWDKLLWYLSIGILGGGEEQEKRTETLFVRWLERGSLPPFWVTPFPKEKTMVELLIGLGKKPKNTCGRNLCQE